MTKKVTKAINFFNILLATIMSLGSGFTCCLTFGHGLGDIIYVFSLWILSGIYLVVQVLTRNKFFNSPVPTILFTVCLICFLYVMVFDRGPECPCRLFSYSLGMVPKKYIERVRRYSDLLYLSVH